MRPFRRAERDGRPGDETPLPVARDDAELLASLMQRVARGDEAAFAEVYDLTSGLVHGICTRVVRNPAQAQEVTQEVYLEAWRNGPRYDGSKGAVTTWLATIAHRRSVDRVRSEEASKAREDSDHRLGVPNNPPNEVGLALDNRLERERVRRAVGTLTEVQREAVTLAYYGGHTYREVAALLQVPEGTIKTRIRDGLIRLRDELGVLV